MDKEILKQIAKGDPHILLVISAADLKEALIEILKKEEERVTPQAKIFGYYDELTTRTCNALKSAGIETFAQLASFDKKKLLKIRNFGKRGMEELNAFIAKYDLNI